MYVACLLSVICPSAYNLFLLVDLCLLHVLIEHSYFSHDLLFWFDLRIIFKYLEVSNSISNFRLDVSWFAEVSSARTAHSVFDDRPYGFDQPSGSLPLGQRLRAHLGNLCTSTIGTRTRSDSQIATWTLRQAQAQATWKSRRARASRSSTSRASRERASTSSWRRARRPRCTRRRPRRRARRL